MGFSLLRRLFPRVELKTSKPVLWVHCASVGEFNTFLPLLKELRRNFFIALTYFSPRAESFLKGKKGLFDFLHPLPMDIPFSVRRFESALKPKALILVEREFWFNLLKATRTKKILVNAYAKGGKLERLLIREFSLILTRTEEDVRRFMEEGARRVVHCGNMKFILEKPKADVPLNIAGDGKVILAGSTHEGEEELILKAFIRLRDRVKARLILAPRHVARAPEVLRLAEAYGLRASLKSGAGKEWDVLVVDTLGELRALYKHCDLAIVGGTFVPVGGHNLLEPLLWGKPVLFGGYTHKVKDLEAFLLATNSGFRVDDPEELTTLLENLIKSPPKAVDIKELSERIKSCYLRHILGELE